MFLGFFVVVLNVLYVLFMHSFFSSCPFHVSGQALNPSIFSVLLEEFFIIHESSSSPCVCFYVSVCGRDWMTRCFTVTPSSPSSFSLIEYAQLVLVDRILASLRVPVRNTKGAPPKIRFVSCNLLWVCE